jgi:hypothetical protein
LDCRRRSSHAKQQMGGSRATGHGECGWPSTPLPPRRPDLQTQAAAFADRTSEVLNRTVTNGIRVRAVLEFGGARGWVGYGIDKATLAPPRGIPLTISAAPPQCYLNVAHTLVQEDGYLVAARSTFGLYLDEELEQNVLHYDYVRDPGNEYPPAHLQVSGASPAFDSLCDRLGVATELGRLHFPVGGKRFRPCLEDVIEMLIVEGLVSGRDGWSDAVEEHRSRFHRIQLMAAVRRDPEAAREELARQDADK